jgi:hypothetical protein
MFGRIHPQVARAVQQYLRDRIVNTDEISWKIVNNRMTTVAEHGSEGMSSQFDGDVKGCERVIASIDSARTKLPLWVICRGKTIRCEAYLHQHLAREVRSGKLVLTHQENGWANVTVVGEYLDCLMDRVKGQNLP